MTGDAARIHVTRHGGPEHLEWVKYTPDDPGADEVQVRHTAVGLNYIDVYHRTGHYPTPACPFVPGLEAAGVVTKVGPGVEALSVGDRVAYAVAPMGAYAEVRNAPASRLVKLPDEIDDRTAAAIMLKGMTAQYLVRRTIELKSGDVVLVHAAAGGVGLLLCQWAKHIGATVIGTVGSEDKARLAADHGCDYPVLYRIEDVRARVRDVTGGDGCRVVYDSVGRDTFTTSLDCLGRRGLLVSFGQSSGPAPPATVDDLRIRGSLFLTRPTLMDYVGTRKELLSTADDLFDVVTSGVVRVQIGQTYPLRDAARAHADLEGRRTTGSTVMLVD